MKILTTAAIALFVSGCVAATGSVEPAANFDAEALRLINSYRTGRGLAPLSSHPLLERLASQHSRYQASRNDLSHDGYRERAAQARAAGLTARCAENVGFRYVGPQQLVAGWRSSAQHNTNLLRPNLRYAGIAVVGSYSTFFACG